MTLRMPRDASRLSAISDFASWKRSAERLLSQFDARIASLSRSDAGMAVVWPAALVPVGWLEAAGQTVPIADHPDLFDAIGTTFNTGGEPAGEFRLPDWTADAPPGGTYGLRG
jgi:hypothetical protein